jgi:hypothetical protein
MKRDYDVKVRVRELKLGDLVYQLDTATVKGKTRKLSPSWKGPGVGQPNLPTQHHHIGCVPCASIYGGP